MVRITPEMWAEKQAKSEFMNMMTDRMGGKNDYDGHTDPATIPMEEGHQKRPDIVVLRDLRADPLLTPEALWALIDDFEISANTEKYNRPDNVMKRMPPLIRANIRREEGNGLFKAGNYVAAIQKYLEAMRFILAPLTTTNPVILPSPTYYSPKYLTIGEHSLEVVGTWMEYVDLLALGGNIIQCYTKLGEHVQTIDWIQEVEQIFMCQRQMALKDMPSWKDSHIQITEYWVARIKSQLRAYKVFSTLGNTSLATHFAHSALNDYTRPDSDRVPKLAAFKKEFDDLKMFSLRHPDPNLIDKTQLTCPEIQVHGTWERLSLASQGTRPSGRCAHSSWIWKSRLYICMGVQEQQMELKDMWYLDLKTGVWKQLPKVPTKRPVYGLSSVRPMRVWRDKVHLFIGTQQLHVFDLITEQWSILKTYLPRNTPWPYSPVGPLVAFNTALLDDKLYVFGGEDGHDSLGENIFMALDLLTNKWEHLSGTSENAPQSWEPNLRTLHSMWAISAQRKIFILYGSANRTAARLARTPGGGEHDFMYLDFWSFHVDDKKWERERLRGSYPSPRTEAASDFSSATGRAVVYGGYHSSMFTMEKNFGGQTGMYDFTFFGDTFVFNPETNIWQHVLVKGFPSYRAMATIACDPDTGKIYLFGGYTNSDFVPAKNISSRVYNDVWTLKVDLPGGNWTQEDLQRDLRAEKMGPWMRCFTCGNCGISWQKCAGACGGKYYFCSKECQRAGWKEHKEKHGCRKL